MLILQLELKSKNKDPASDTKKRTSTIKCVKGKALFRETLPMEVREGAEELRIIVCKTVQTRDGPRQSVIAACGLYIRDVLAGK